MKQVPDLSAVPPELASDGMLAQTFRVRESAPKPYEAGLKPPNRTFELMDGAAFAHVWGEGERVLLAHGWEGRHSQFAPLIAALTAEGMQVIALDMPGHGLAKGVKSNPLEFSRAVQTAGAQFEGFSAMIGHSQGANAVAHAAAKGTKADKLVLISPAVSVATYLETMCQMIRATPQTVELFFKKVTGLVGVAPSEFELPDLASAIAQLTLIIHDRDDRELPFTLSERLVAALPAGTLIPTDKLGHRRILEDPDVVRRVTELIFATE